MMVFVAVLWLLVIVGVGLDAWEVREQARADARRRAAWWEVSCGCPGCVPMGCHVVFDGGRVLATAGGAREFKGERMTLDVPVTTESRAAWGRLRNALCNTRQQRRKAARSSSRARLLRSVLRALRKRQSVRKLLPVRGMFR